MSALVQGKSGAASAASLALAFTSNNVAGNTLIAYSPNVNNTGTVSDSQGNTWVCSANGWIWYALNCKAGANTITIALTGATYIEATFAECQAASAVDQSATGSGTGTAATTSSVTTTGNGELIVGAFSGGTFTAGSGFTAVAANPGSSLLEVQTQTTAGAIAATATLSTSGTWYCDAVTFKAAAGTAHTTTLTETFTITDRGLAKTPQRHVTDAFTLTDRGVAKLSQRSFLESFSLSDVFSSLRARALSLVDSFSLSESITRSSSKKLTDALSLADTIAKTTQRGLVDSFSVTERILRSVARTLNDALLLSEIFAVARAKVLALVDSFTLSETLQKTPGKLFAETLTLADTLHRATSKLLADGFVLSDSIARSIARSFTDALTLAERMLFNAIGPNDALRKYFVQIWRRLFASETRLRSFAAAARTRAWSATEHMIITDPKDSEASEDFQLDWSSIVASDTIQESSWEVPQGLESVATEFTTTTTTIRLGGGTAGTKYVVKNLVTLASGQIKAQSLLVPVQ